MSELVVPRVLGGTIILQTEPPPLSIAVIAIGSDGQVTATGSDGMVTAVGSDGQVSGTD